MKARLVLNDAMTAISNHGDHLKGEKFRVSWFGIVALLRAVGHVLSKVDVESDPCTKRAIEEKWCELQKSKPEPIIFWGFIEAERNRFLKNYEHGVIRQQVFKLNGSDQGLSLDHANSTGGLTQLLSFSKFPEGIENEAIVSLLSSGPFRGRPEKEVALEACTWWETYLNQIEYLAKSYQAV